jgi:hypothetical protein
MMSELLPDQAEIAANTVVAGTVAAASMLRIGYGRVWVTQEGQAGDFWIDGGDTLMLQPGSLIVIEAAVPSWIAVELLAAGRASRASGPPAPLRNRLAQQMRSLGSILPRLPVAQRGRG